MDDLWAGETSAPGPLHVASSGTELFVQSQKKIQTLFLKLLKHLNSNWTGSNWSMLSLILFTQPHWAELGQTGLDSPCLREEDSGLELGPAVAQACSPRPGTKAFYFSKYATLQQAGKINVFKLWELMQGTKCKVWNVVFSVTENVTGVKRENVQHPDDALSSHTFQFHFRLIINLQDMMSRKG